MTIKAIETRYKGYRFRSRLEARWAVFFETLGLTWEYEKEGYDLGPLGYYLPDFWLPNFGGEGAPGLWIEVKPDTGLVIETQREVDKLQALTTNDGVAAVIYGDPGSYRAGFFMDGKLIGWRFEFQECVRCEILYFISDSGIHYPSGTGCDCCWTDRPKQAIQAARSARFEHGESP